MQTELFDNDFFVTKIVLAMLVKSGTGAAVHKNRPSHGFGYNMGGKKILHFKDGTNLTVKENDIFYMPQFSDYTVETAVPADCYAINFLLDGNFAAKPFKIRIKSDKIFQSFKKAEFYFRTQKYGYKEKCLKELYEIVCFIKQALYEQNYLSQNQYKILNKAKEYISSHYTESITLPALSEQCGVSEVYLRRLFGKEYGVSPVAYINQLRLSYANSLLLSGEYSVSDVCFMSGFCDVSYFCRAYKNKYGFSPKQTSAVCKG